MSQPTHDQGTAVATQTYKNLLEQLSVTKQSYHSQVRQLKNLHVQFQRTHSVQILTEIDHIAAAATAQVIAAERACLSALGKSLKV